MITRLAVPVFVAQCVIVCSLVYFVHVFILVTIMAEFDLRVSICQFTLVMAEEIKLHHGLVYTEGSKVGHSRFESHPRVNFVLPYIYLFTCLRLQTLVS